MRKQTWIRFGLSSVIVGSAAFAALGVGCSGDDTAVTPAGDSGHADTSFQDTGLGEGGGNEAGETGTDGGLKHAKIIIVHGSPYAPDLRFCFGTGAKADGSDLAVGPLPALPHDDSNLGGRAYPGLYVGTGGALPDLTDLETKAITGFVIPLPQAKIAGDVKSNAAEHNCGDIIGATGGGGILAPTEFLKIPTIPAGTFVKGNTYLLALTGCLPGDTSGLGDGKAKCGPNYATATGNLGIRIIKLDKTVADSAKLGVQVIHLAQPVDGFLPLGNGGFFDQGVKTTIGLTRDDLDGGNPPNAPIAVGINYGYGLDGGTATPQTYANADYAHAIAYAVIKGYHTVPANADAGTDASTVALTAANPGFPFGALQKLTYGGFDGGIGVGPAGLPIYTSGGNYTLIFLGDPTAQQLVVDGGLNPAYDGHGVHMMMFPNDPPLPSL